MVRTSSSANNFVRNDGSHCDGIHSSLTSVHCLDDGYEGKQLVTWKEYCAEDWLKVPEESMDRCTGQHDITKMALKIGLNTINRISALSFPLCYVHTQLFLYLNMCVFILNGFPCGYF